MGLPRLHFSFAGSASLWETNRLPQRRRARKEKLLIIIGLRDLPSDVYCEPCEISWEKRGPSCHVHRRNRCIICLRNSSRAATAHAHGGHSCSQELSFKDPEQRSRCAGLFAA